MTSTRSLIDTLKRRAGAMARPFIDAGHQPDASEIERAFGEAAQLILRDAESRAQMLPRDEFERRVEAFKGWQRRREARMRREIERLSNAASGRRRRVRSPRRTAGPPPSSTIARRNFTNGWTAMRWLHGSAPPRTC